jgi:cyclin-dependent kinase
VEHLEENGKPCLYLVFEYLSTDLKKYMDAIGKGPAFPLAPELVKVGKGGRGGARA